MRPIHPACNRAVVLGFHPGPREPFAVEE